MIRELAPSHGRCRLGPRAHTRHARGGGARPCHGEERAAAPGDLALAAGAGVLSAFPHHPMVWIRPFVPNLTQPPQPPQTLIQSRWPSFKVVGRYSRRRLRPLPDPRGGRHSLLFLCRRQRGRPLVGYCTATSRRQAAVRVAPPRAEREFPALLVVWAYQQKQLFFGRGQFFSRV